MDPVAKKLILTLILVAIGVLGVTLVVLEGEQKTRVMVSVPVATQGACGCAAKSTYTTQYLIFWKDKEGQRASPVLFPSLASASLAIPRDAEEARIVPVRIDGN